MFKVVIDGVTQEVKYTTARLRDLEQRAGCSVYEFLSQGKHKLNEILTLIESGTGHSFDDSPRLPNPATLADHAKICRDALFHYLGLDLPPDPSAAKDAPLEESPKKPEESPSSTGTA